jgi:signal transduction histidine kinase
MQLPRIQRPKIQPPRPGALALRNWPVSRRLVAVIVMAIVMGLVFGGLRVTSAIGTANSFSRTSQLAVLGSDATALAQALENERDLTAALCASSPGGTCPAAGQKLTGMAQSLQLEVQRAQAATNAAAGPVQTLAAQIGSGFPASTQAKAAAVVAMIQHIGGSQTAGVRSSVAGQSAQSVISAYSEAVADVFDLNDEITSGSGDALLSNEVRTLDSVSRAKDQESQERAILYIMLLQNSYGGALQSLTTAQALESSYLDAFQSSATPAEEDNFLSAVSAEKVDTTTLLSSFLTSASSPALTPIEAFSQALENNEAFSQSLENLKQSGQSTSPAAQPSLWYSTMTDTISQMRGIELQVAHAIVARSQLLEQGAQQSALLAAVVTVGVLLLVLIATLLVARSLVDPLRRLQADALEVATVRLPSRVAELSQTTDPDVSLAVEPIGVDSTDEIGRVARAFDQVHQEAVRLAGNEAMLRGNVSAMFISLSRRSVPLIDRLARMIDTLEQNEDDPDRLSSLFAMDHLVTRMRRNSENLLVLAGEEPVRKWIEPVPLPDVARAATSEIEQYGRVVLNIQPGIVVSGQAAADIVHLLAEIIENATMFSPADTSVEVTGEEVPSGGVLLEVKDSGIGISPARLEEINWRFDNPPLVDVSVSRHMGLFAVSRLAARHGVRIRLRAAQPQGLSALVWLPGNLTSRGSVRYIDQRSQQLAQESFTTLLGMGGRRRATRPAMAQGMAVVGTPVPDAADGQPDVAEEAATAPAGPRSSWFRAKKPSGRTRGAAGATAGATAWAAPVDSDWSAASVPTAPTAPAAPAAPAAPVAWSGWGTQGNTQDGWSNQRGWANQNVQGNQGSGWNGGWDDPGVRGAPQNVPNATGTRDGWTDTGWRIAERLGPPVLGDRTAAGLPARVPGANLFPGAGRGSAARGQAPARPADAPKTEPLLPGRRSPLPRRSPELARTRLSGFQLGSREAEAGATSAGEGASR